MGDEHFRDTHERARSHIFYMIPRELKPGMVLEELEEGFTLPASGGRRFE